MKIPTLPTPVMMFGKYKGQPYTELPYDYLRFLAGWGGRKAFKTLDDFLTRKNITPLSNNEVYKKPKKLEPDENGHLPDIEQEEYASLDQYGQFEDDINVMALDVDPFGLNPPNY